jgi:predicted RNase H-like nuclease (RuvC/YqgF family)
MKKYKNYIKEKLEDTKNKVLPTDKDAEQAKKQSPYDKLKDQIADRVIVSDKVQQLRQQNVLDSVSKKIEVFQKEIEKKKEEIDKRIKNLEDLETSTFSEETKKKISTEIENLNKDIENITKNIENIEKQRETLTKDNV